jgi:hypothetical protein
MMEHELAHRMKKGESRSTALSALHRELGPQLGIFERVILDHLSGVMDVTD